MTITLITGANKGLGYESARRLTAEGHTVYLGARDLEKGQSAAAQLGARPVQIDVTDDASIQAAMAEIDEREGRLDVLVNNAGIWDNLDGADELTATMAFDQFDTNATGVVRTTQAALALLRRSDNPVVVNVSSGLGSFAMVTDPASHQFGVHSIVYSATKAAVDMLTVRYAQAVPDIKFNAVDPGFLATDLHGNSSAQDPAIGAEVVARMAIIDRDGPTGTFQCQDGELAW
ncbi:SDR family NAD(P)-dependent oxidoreductase [Actinoplanes sp. NPDC089786]|uniref:SDR family NAD(P)-dependent oxidoreductase n=1 Tax=Actinoplanes sp. NPDC089786 TaxID=3155185 RepID=UPI00341D8781